jgi:hypothetical protein
MVLGLVHLSHAARRSVVELGSALLCDLSVVEDMRDCGVAGDIDL